MCYIHYKIYSKIEITNNKIKININAHIKILSHYSFTLQGIVLRTAQDACTMTLPACRALVNYVSIVTST